MSTKQAIKTQINEFLGTANLWEGISIPPRYELTDKGVYRQEPPLEPGGEPVDIFICGAIWVRSYEINDLGIWNVNLEFIDRIGGQQTYSVALSRLYGSASTLGSELAGLGLRLARSEVSSLSSYLSAFTSPVVEHERKKSEAEQIVDNVREFILKNEDRFQNSDAFPVRSRAGYRLRDADEWGMTKSALVEASGCHSATKAARVLVKAGLLHCNETDHLTAWRDTPAGRTRLYCVKGIILECDTPTFCAPVSGAQPQSENQTGAAETRATSAPAPVAPFCPVSVQLSESGLENATNPIVMTIGDHAMIDKDYQPDIHELDAATSLMSPPHPLEIEENDHENHDENISHAYAAYAAEHGIEVRH